MDAARRRANRSGRSSRPCPAPPLGWTSVRPVHVPGTVPGTCPNVDVSQTRPASSAAKDIGDSYNYAPPADDVLVDVPTRRANRDARGRAAPQGRRAAPNLRVGRPERRDADALRAARRRIVRPGPARARQHLRRPARARARATARACGELACRGSVRGGRAQSRGGRWPRRGRRPDVSGLRFRRRGRDGASPRPRHRVRGRRRRARADRVALDRLTSASTGTRRAKSPPAPRSRSRRHNSAARVPSRSRTTRAPTRSSNTPRHTGIPS